MNRWNKPVVDCTMEIGRVLQDPLLSGELVRFNEKGNSEHEEICFMKKYV